MTWSTTSNSLISEFEGALDFQNDDKGLWGQHNANLSMGDFADNWPSTATRWSRTMKKLRDNGEEGRRGLGAGRAAAARTASNDEFVTVRVRRRSR